MPGCMSRPWAETRARHAQAAASEAAPATPEALTRHDAAVLAEPLEFLTQEIPDAGPAGPPAGPDPSESNVGW